MSSLDGRNNPQQQRPVRNPSISNSSSADRSNNEDAVNNSSNNNNDNEDANRINSSITTGNNNVTYNFLFRETAREDKESSSIHRSSTPATTASTTDRTIPTAGGGLYHHNHDNTDDDSHRSIHTSLMSDRRAYFASVQRNNEHHQQQDLQQQQQAKNDDESYRILSSILSNASAQSLSPRKRSLKKMYDWRTYSPSGPNGTYLQFIRWLINGDGNKYAQPPSHEKYLNDLYGLIHCITLLRYYIKQYGRGIDEIGGGPSDQSYVLREMTRDLYSGGAPLWALESVMQRAAEGLTGDPNVNWCFLPRRAFFYHHASSTAMSSIPTTSMFKLDRGFNISRLDAMEPIVVRLASFASNTNGVGLLPNSHFPTVDEFNLIANQYFQTQSQQQQQANQSNPVDNYNKAPTNSMDYSNVVLEKDNVVFENVANNNLNRNNNNENNNNHQRRGMGDRNYNSNNNGHTDNATQSRGNIDFTSMDESEEHETKILHDKDYLATEILNLASETQGLFYYINSMDYKSKVVGPPSDYYDFDNSNYKKRQQQPIIDNTLWTVSNEERECFSRLACIEAMKSIDQIDDEGVQHPLYNYWLIVVFRATSSAGACAIWFNGSWYDMIIAGFFSVLVAYIGQSSLLSKQEKIIFEAVASYVVGLLAGIVAITLPTYTCYSAIAISGVLDILQGFRVVYAIVEVLSRNTVAGGADFLEGILFTGLIAYFLRFGQYTAVEIFDRNDMNSADDINTEWGACTNGISKYWYFLFVPLASLSWSGLFTPNYDQLLPMCFHGTLAYVVTFGLSYFGATVSVNNFVSAASITFSAALFSRFTGRQAVGNTVAGLYALLPGAYLVKSFNSYDTNTAFFAEILEKAISIGIGSWTGTLLCSPTLLSTTRGLVQQQQHLSTEYDLTNGNDFAGAVRNRRYRGRAAAAGGAGTQTTMFYF